MTTYTLWITGMACDHCALTAEEVLNREDRGERLRGEFSRRPKSRAK